jgi:uncharacterized membrane-anchored protein
MSKEGKIRKLIVVGSVLSGVVAAYLMYRRDTPLLTIARKTVTNPIGALVGELRGAQ